MSGARTIEVQQDPNAGLVRVRLRDGDQVLASRMLDEGCPEDRVTWTLAWEYMRAHGCAVGINDDVAEGSFALAVSHLFPEFGTAPDGVELK